MKGEVLTTVRSFPVEGKEMRFIREFPTFDHIMPRVGHLVNSPGKVDLPPLTGRIYARASSSCADSRKWVDR
jgi:hypothetical protein